MEWTKVPSFRNARAYLPVPACCLMSGLCPCCNSGGLLDTLMNGAFCVQRHFWSLFFAAIIACLFD